MMTDFNNLFKGGGGEVVLFVFPHFDDCAFVSSGLIQFALKAGVKTHVLVLNEKSDKVGETEFIKYTNDLGVAKSFVVRVTHASIKENILKLINNIEPSVVVTFEPGGVTGNSHHTLISLKTYEVMRDLKKDRPKLLWRIADSEEIKYFGQMPSPLGRKYTDILKLNLRLGNSAKKIRAIFSNRSKMKDLSFKLRDFGVVLVRS
jgi:hypothetical protein